jgi:hypothetical protein
MSTVEKGLVSVATVKHARMVAEIALILFKNRDYYQKYVKCDLKLKFREYEVLELGLLGLINSRNYNPPVIELKYLNSILKSFELLEGRYLSSIGEKNYPFIMALEVCREHLSHIGSELFEEFQSKME